MSRYIQGVVFPRIVLLFAICIFCAKSGTSCALGLKKAKPKLGSHVSPLPCHPERSTTTRASFEYKLVRRNWRHGFALSALFQFPQHQHLLRRLPNSSAATNTSLLSRCPRGGAAVSQWVGDSAKRCWAILIFAIVVEIGATTLVKIGSDSSNAMTTSLAMGLYLASLLCFAASLKKIDVSIAYAVWSAVGTASVAVVGILFFDEKFTLVKFLSILLILVGVVGLNLQDGGH